MKHILASLVLVITLPAAAQDPSANCFAMLASRQSLSLLGPVIALGSIKNQTMDMMTNTRYPTSAEKDVIKIWVKARDQCFVMGESWRLENMPENMRSILDDFYARNKLLIAHLYLAQISFGEFASKRAALSSALNAALNEAWSARRDGHPANPASDMREQLLRTESRTKMLAAATQAFDDDGTPEAAVIAPK